MVRKGQDEKQMKITPKPKREKLLNSLSKHLIIMFRIGMGRSSKIRKSQFLKSQHTKVTANVN